MDKIALQNKEFDALTVLAERWNTLRQVPVVDDEYPLYRGRYESALRDFIAATRANGRLLWDEPIDLSPAAAADRAREWALDVAGRELIKAQSKFPPFNSGHEGYAVILEELDELWIEILSNQATPGREDRMRKEAVPGPLVIGISGRICAGKTTAARLFERIGFAYTRFSLVIDEEIIARGELPTRETRQRTGLEINRMKRQRWLCERVIGRVRDQAFIVVDGLRFREDHAFLTERFGARFLHLHVIARTDIRRERYDRQHIGDTSFNHSDTDAVEGEVDDLARLAQVTVDNSATIDDLRTAVGKIAENLASRDGVACQSQ